MTDRPQAPARPAPARPGWLRPAQCALYPLLTAFALAVLTALPDGEAVPAPRELLGLVRGEGAVWLVLVLGLAFCYGRLLPLRDRFLPSAAGVAALFSLFLLLGRSYEASDSWALVFGGPERLVLACAVFLGCFLFFHALVGALFCRLDRLSPPDRSAALSRTGQLRFYLICLGLLLLFWLPYLALCYPGSVTYDGLYQLGQYFGRTPPTNHHPWLSTLVMGFFVGLGGENTALGVFFYVLFQALVCAAAFAGVCRQVRMLAPGPAAWLTLAFFALVPTWGSYAQMFVKDTLFCGLFAAFFVLCVLFVRRRGRCAPAVWAGLFLLGLACALLRNNGLYTVVPTLLLLAAAAKTPKTRAAAAALGLAVLGLYLGFVQLCLPARGVEPGSVREVLSLPFQQTARYVRTYSGELTQEEIAVIDGVLDYDALLTSYDPRVSDPVKNTYHGDKEALGAYLRLWVRQGLRHPGVYVDAAANSMFGYFLPGYRYGSFGGNYFLMQEPNYGIALEFARPNAVRLLDGFSRLWSRLPGLALLNAPGTFSWLLILCTAALLRKRLWPALIPTVPVWLSLAICCVSPVNGLVRYMLPIMAAAPLLLAHTFDALRPKLEGGHPCHG